jgi:hypothetical protein
MRRLPIALLTSIPGGGAGACSRLALRLRPDVFLLADGEFPDALRVDFNELA